MHLHATCAKRMLVMVSLLIAFVISCLFIWHSATQYTQPTYGGESLSAWLAQYETNLLRDDMESLAHGAEAARAIRAIGSNAIPFLLKMLEVTNSQTDAILKKVFSRSHTPADVINARDRVVSKSLVKMARMLCRESLTFLTDTFLCLRNLVVQRLLAGSGQPPGAQFRHYCDILAVPTATVWRAYTVYTVWLTLTGSQILQYLFWREQ